MAKSARIKINSKEAQRLLQGPEVYGDIKRRTDRVARAAGRGFKAETKVVGGSSKLGRAMGYVSTDSPEGRRRQARDPVLQRALSAGGSL